MRREPVARSCRGHRCGHEATKAASSLPEGGTLSHAASAKEAAVQSSFFRADALHSASCGDGGSFFRVSSGRFEACRPLLSRHRRYGPLPTRLALLAACERPHRLPGDMDGLASHHPPSAAYWPVRPSMLEWSAVRQVQLTRRLDPTYSIGQVEAPSSVCEPLLLRQYSSSMRRSPVMLRGSFESAQRACPECFIV